MQMVRYFARVHHDVWRTDGCEFQNAASRIALGAGSIAMWWYKDWRALGWATMASAVMGATDGFVAEKLGGDKTV